MRLRLFRAATVSEAMARIRTELGPDALILSTRRLGNDVEITAAVEHEQAAAPVAPPRPPVQPAPATAYPELPDDDRWPDPAPYGSRDQNASSRAMADPPASRKMPHAPQPWPTPPRMADHAAPPRMADHAAPPRLADRAAPPRMADHAAPPRMADHAAPPRLADHAAPPRMADHAAPPRMADHAAPPRMADRSAGQDFVPAPRRMPNAASEREAERQRLHNLLGWHGVPATLAMRLAESGTDEALPSFLAAELHFAALPLGYGDRPLVIAGPPGAGKTLTVARLATRLVMAGIEPMAITADGQRAGATEQLLAYTSLLSVSLIVAGDPRMLRRALTRREAGAPVLIDTPGIDAFDPLQLESIAALAAEADATLVLVLPAGLDVAEASDMAAAFASIGASHLVATRLDLSRRLGSILAAAGVAIPGGSSLLGRPPRLALAEAGIGPGAADGLIPMTPQLLAARLTAGATHQRRDPNGSLR